MSRRIRIGTYNIRDLFAWVSVKGRRRRKRALAVKDACAEIIRKADCDLLALQEVGDDRSLEDFNQHRLGALYAHQAMSRGNSERGIHVALLSRFPVNSLLSHRETTLMQDDELLRDLQDRPLGFRRDLLQAEVEIGEHRLTLFLAHLKSQRPLDRRRFDLSADNYRRAEAEAAARLIAPMATNPKASHFAVLGDFNDDDRPDSPIAPLAEMTGLFDPLKEEVNDPEERWTAQWRRFGRRRFDYALLSESLRPFYINGSVRVHREGESAAYASDHRLVSVDLRLPD